jgi:hypothetical protein
MLARGGARPVRVVRGRGGVGRRTRRVAVVVVVPGGAKVAAAGAGGGDAVRRAQVRAARRRAVAHGRHVQRVAVRARGRAAEDGAQRRHVPRRRRVRAARVRVRVRVRVRRGGLCGGQRGEHGGRDAARAAASAGGRVAGGASGAAGGTGASASSGSAASTLNSAQAARWPAHAADAQAGEQKRAFRQLAQTSGVDAPQAAQGVKTEIGDDMGRIITGSSAELAS